MKIVEFTPDLIPSVVALQSACFSDGWTESMMRSAFENGRYYGFCAFSDNALIGFIACSLGFDDCDLEGVAVLPEFRRKGVAHTLIEHAEQKAKQLNKTAFLLEVRQSNTPAQNLYVKKGYKQISVRKKYYADGEDAVVMKKELV